MARARLDGAIVGFDSFDEIRAIHGERSREICDRRTGEYFAVIIHQPRIRRWCLYQIRKCIVFRRVPSFAIEDQYGAGWIVRTGEFVGDGHVSEAFVDEALTAAVDENPFVDEGIESRIRPEAIIGERFARDQMAVEIL